MANQAGSTLFIPIADAAEQVLALMAMVVGNVIVHADAGGPTGDFEPFVRSGLLDAEKRVQLSVFLQMAYEANTSERAFIGHNIVLAMQAIGLAGFISTA